MESSCGEIISLQVSIEERASCVKGAKWNTSDDFCVLHINIYFVS